MTDWLRLQATFPRERAERLANAMESSGALAVTLENAGEEDYYDTALPGEPLWALQRVTGLYPGDADADALARSLEEAFPGLKLHAGQLADQDWERSWLEHFHPVEVGRRLWVCPSWLEPVDEEAVNLRIDPGLAFGAGTHATTRLCLEYLSGMELDGLAVIDFGCGSGILAIAALLLGAQHATGVDVDPRALEASLENARRNGVEARFAVAEAEGAEAADVVVANILAPTLVELAPLLTALVKPGGVLLLSGILEGQREEVESRFRRSFRFTCRQREEWLLLAGRRK